MTQATPLRLLAEDAEDLKVIAAALQDAVGKIGDISYEPAARRLTLAFNRYRWEGEGGERVRAALQLGGVLQVQARKLRRNARDAVIELLDVGFEPGEAPGGAVSFTFAGGGDLRAQVECLDVVLADVSAPWATPRTPKHDL
ncbi:DUF2948 family protein [Phenylobacterium sp.]|uniref:DUF2948 family protein n=1 Tax=Phenylobacterium sp. TaxID=1871053 RepID=UPI00289DC072|nr:DUF2948 family protein [Phenylobacterium sp.]